MSKSHSRTKKKQPKDIRPFFYIFHIATTDAATVTVPSQPSAPASSMKTTEANLDKLPNEFVKMPENPFRSNQKPCKNLSADDYLLSKTYSRNIVNIDRMKLNDSSHSNHLPISIDVKHEQFDTKNGLVRNIVYTGMLLDVIFIYIYFRIECFVLSENCIESFELQIH